MPRFLKLWQDVESSVAIKDYPAAQLREVLETHRAAFQAPLFRYERTAEARAAVESGRIKIGGETHVLTRDFTRLALDLAERLQLHELTAVMLLRDAHARQSLHPGIDLRDIATDIYFEERRSLLYALVTLLKARLEPRVAAPVAAVVAEFTDSLVDHGLIHNLLTGIAADLADLQRPSPIPPGGAAAAGIGANGSIALTLAELKDACTATFHVAYQYALAPGDIVQMLGLLRKFKRDDNPGLVDAADTLLLALLAAFDPLAVLTDAKQGAAATNPLARNEDALRTLHPVITGTWDDGSAAGRRAALVVAWTLLLDASRAQAAIRTPLDAAQVASLRQDAVDAAWAELARVAQSPRVRGDAENRDVFASVLDRLLVQYISGLSLTDYHVLFPRHEPQRQLSLMRLIAALYADQLEFGLKFWGVEAAMAIVNSAEASEAQSLRQFLGFLVESCSADTMVPLLECMTSLACGENASLEAYKFLRNSPIKRVHWDFFFLSIGNYVTDFTSEKRLRLSLQESDTRCLCAICKLVATIARWNAQARIWLFENESWRVLQNLFGLVMCAVPHELKGALTEAIAAFALTPAIATSVIWTYLEQSQILPTLPGHVGATDTGIRFEVDAVEARAGSFPYLGAFLLLLHTLFKTAPVPDTLGAGQRVPGVLPYLAFVRDAVFLRIDALPFSDLCEKWIITQRCLSIFLELLKRAELSTSDFATTTTTTTTTTTRRFPGGDVPKEKSPAYELLTDFLGHGRVLRALLAILVKAAAASATQGCTAEFGQATLLALRILDTVYSLSEEFTLKESAAGIARIEAQSLRASLTRDPAYTLAIGRLIGCSTVPGVSLYAARIIRTLSSQTDIVARIFSEPSVHLDMIAAFVLCLQNEESLVGGEDTLASDEPRETARRVVMRILIENLPRPTPNLTQGLLTYRPGVPLDFISSRIITPLHQVLTLLEPDRMLVKRDPLLCEGCYEFIYRLLSDRELWRPVAALLHAEPNEFVLNGIRAFPLELPQEEPWALASHLMTLAWFLRTTAADIRLAAISQNRSHLVRLMENLFMHQRAAMYDTTMDIGGGGGGGGSRALALFSALNVFVDEPIPIAPTLFRNVDVRSCMYMNKRGITETNIPLLTARLMEARAQIVAANSGYATAADSEMRSILLAVVRHNNYQNVQGALYRAYESWKQVVEVTIFSAFQHISYQMRESVLFELLEGVLARASSPTTASSVSGILSVVALSLVSKLRACRPIFDFARRTGGLPPARVVEIVRGLVACALKPGSDVLLRGNIYAAIYHFLRFCSRSPIHMESAVSLAAAADATVFDEIGGGAFTEEDLARLEEMHKQHELLEESLADLLAERGWDRLFEHAWRDALEAPAVWRAVVAATLQELHRLDARRDSHWLRTIAAGRGYLKGLADATAAELRLAYDSPEALCVHESRLALLASISQSGFVGASLLFQADAVGVLSRCTALSGCGGDGDGGGGGGDLAEWDEDERQTAKVHVLLPVLRFVASMLVSLGDNVPLAVQATDLLRLCSDMLISLLRATRDATIERLQAVDAICAIFHALAPNERLFAERLPASGANFRQLLLSLFARCSYYSDAQLGIEPATLLCSACGEVLAYCLELLSGGRQALFAASVAEQPQAAGETLPSPPLGYLVSFISWALLWHRTLLKRLNSLASTSAMISQVSSARLASLAQVPEVERVLVDELDLPVRQQLAKAKLAEEAAAIRQSLSQFRRAIESGLLVLLKHVEFLVRSPAQGRLVLPEPVNALRRGLIAALEEPRGELAVSISVALDDMERTSTKPSSTLRTIFRQLKDLLNSS